MSSFNTDRSLTITSATLCVSLVATPYGLSLAVLLCSSTAFQLPKITRNAAPQWPQELISLLSTINIPTMPEIKYPLTAPQW
jgi:hypothetical protein